MGSSILSQTATLQHNGLMNSKYYAEYEACLAFNPERTNSLINLGKRCFLHNYLGTDESL